MMGAGERGGQRSARRIGGLGRRVAAFAVAAGVVLAGLTGGGVEPARAGDGSTPANEGICDPLTQDGVTKGLYGLCVAYCEAQDLDSLSKEPPKTKILENYRKRKQSDDPAMPCVQASCPCWTDEQLGTISADGLAAACLRNEDSIQLINNDVEKDHFAFADTARNRCSYENENLDPPVINSQRVTPEQAQVCFDEVDAACDALGL